MFPHSTTAIGTVCYRSRLASAVMSGVMSDTIKVGDIARLTSLGPHAGVCRIVAETPNGKLIGCFRTWRSSGPVIAPAEGWQKIEDQNAEDTETEE